MVEASSVLRRLRDRLVDVNVPVVERPVYVPEQKALLSRDGGVCPEDGARLTFDPLSPVAHRCPGCGAVFRRERDHRAWVWRYQIWLSERAINRLPFPFLLSTAIEPSRSSRRTPTGIGRIRTATTSSGRPGSSSPRIWSRSGSPRS